MHLAQQPGGSTFSIVITSPTGLNGPVSVTLPVGTLRNPIAPGSVAVRLPEQSNAGWVTLNQWTPVAVPSNLSVGLAVPVPGSLTSATVSEYTWTEVHNSNSGTTYDNTALSSVVITSTDQGLIGLVTIAFANGMLRNPPAPAQVIARLTEQCNAGSVSLEGSVNVGVPVNLQATVGAA